jgi:hypothetical protein
MTRQDRHRSRVGAVVVAIPLVAAGTLVGLAGWLFASLTCDDACGSTGSWRGDPGAWQWHAQGWLALSVFLASLAGAFLVVAGRRRAAATAAVAGLVAAGAWFALLSSG